MYTDLDIALTFFFAIFVIIDIFVNVVLGLAIHRKRSLQTPMNLLILHLAVTDIIIGIFIIPRHILNYAIPYPNDTSSDYICKFVTGGNFIWTSVTAASGFLTIIAMERLFAVVFPHKSNLRITKRRLKWLVLACWLSSLAFNLPSLLVLKYDHQQAFCLEHWPAWVNPKAYVGLAFFAGNFSVFAMYILYSIILYSLWKKNKAVSEVSRTARINARKRVTKMLILMTVVHMLCRTPNYTFYTLIYFDPGAKYGSTVYSFTVFLILLNSASHPFFYCWYMDNLRKQVFAMLPHFCSGRCPARLRTSDIASTREESGSVTNPSRKNKVEQPFYSCTLGSESEEELKRMRIKVSKIKAFVNKEVEVSDSSGNQNTPVTAKKKLATSTQGSCENKTTNHEGIDEKTESGNDNVVDIVEENDEKDKHENQTTCDNLMGERNKSESNKGDIENQQYNEENLNEQGLKQDGNCIETVEMGNATNVSNDNNSINDKNTSNDINYNNAIGTEDVFLGTEPVDV